MTAESLPGARLTRVRFVEDAAAGARVLLRFHDPRAAVAVAEELAAGPAPAPAAAPGELLFLHLPALPEEMNERLPQAERWIGAGALRVKLGAGWLLYLPGRAAHLGPAGAEAPMLAAAADFAFYETELAALERELAADWPRAQADAPLAHEISGAAAARCAGLEAMSTATLLRRIRHARLEPRLLYPPAELTPEARSAAARLREKAGVEARLETADGQLETYEHIYELASQRLSEHRHFRVERGLEIAIVALLAAETILVAWELWIALRQGGE